MKKFNLLPILISFILLIIIGVSITLYFGLFNTSIPSLRPTPGKCKILEQKFCNQVKFKNVGNQVVAFYKVPKGTTLFVPTDYQSLQAFGEDSYQKNKNAPFVAITTFNQAQQLTANAQRWTIYYMYNMEKLPKDPSGKINQVGSKGQILDIISNTSFAYPNTDYNLYIVVHNINYALVHPSNTKEQYINITKSELQP